MFINIQISGSERFSVGIYDAIYTMQLGLSSSYNVLRSCKHDSIHKLVSIMEELDYVYFSPKGID